MGVPALGLPWVGNKLASRHIAEAQEQCRRRFVSLPSRDLAYLVEGEPEFEAYLEALLWAQRFALLNREEMMDRVLDQLSRFLETDVVRAKQVGCHHNYTGPGLAPQVGVLSAA